MPGKDHRTTNRHSPETLAIVPEASRLEDLCHLGVDGLPPETTPLGATCLGRAGGRGCGGPLATGVFAIECWGLEIP